MILGEVELVAWARRKGVVDEAGVTLERRADARALRRGEVVVEQVVRPADRVQQMAGGEIDVRLVVGVAPRLVVDRGQRPRLRRRQVLGLSVDGVGQRRLRRSRTRRCSASGAPADRAPAAARLFIAARFASPSTIRRDASCARARASASSPALVTNTRGCTPTSSGLSATLCASSSSNGRDTISCANAGQRQTRTEAHDRHDGTIHHATSSLWVRLQRRGSGRPASA